MPRQIDPLTIDQVKFRGASLRVTVLVFHGVSDLGLGLVLGALAEANRALGSPFFQVQVKAACAGSGSKTAAGLPLVVEKAGRAAPDCVIVPGAEFPSVTHLNRALRTDDTRRLVELLSLWRAKGSFVAGASTSSFFMAASGMLNGSEATTCWWLMDEFAERYPAVSLDRFRMVVPCQGMMTSGSATGHLDLALAVIKAARPEVVATTERRLLFEKRRSQADFVAPSENFSEDPLVERFKIWARDHLGHNFTVAAAVESLGTSMRELQRRTEASIGISPMAYYQRLRLDRATDLIGRGSRMADVARELGYSDRRSLSRLLRERGVDARLLRSARADKPG